ncbi:hypothetical protein [Thermotoga caldifontis]|uniref:hypothetical protein n=1 Tax=Thermotoga caldifontis TaxID=1508419 RepID=UPI000A534484|nr:hypothetical protein [Thermotoga caldifontis]
MRKLLVLFVVALCVVLLAGEVSIWSWRSQDADVWKQVEQELRKMGKDIKINFTAFAPTEYDAKITVALQTGTGPDIVYSRKLPG